VLRFSVDSPLPYRPTDVDVFLADREDASAPARAVVLPSLPGVSLSKDGLSLQSISEPARASSVRDLRDRQARRVMSLF
jgi:hypothetical protein